MALPIDQRIVNNDVELKAIAEVLKAFEDGSKDITQKLTAQIAAAQKNLDEQARKSKEALYNRIAALYSQGIIKNDAQASKLAAAEIQKQYNDKLQSEIEILRYISSENEAERKKKQKEFEMERDILNLRAEGREDEARQKEKELAKQKKKDKREQEKKDKQEEGDSYEFGDIFYDSFKALHDEVAEGNSLQKTAEQNMVNAMKGVGHAITDGLNAINAAISEYAKYQTAINARLQGASSYSEAVNMLSKVAFSPLLRAEDLYANLADLVGQGIVTNVEQRAMFETVKDGIAGTFDVTSDSLKRLIRLQQNDSTAARLGMEAYLTKFLNVYVENTEYLQSTFDNVSSSLLEASAMMHLNSAAGANASAELEYVIQKWLGTLSGVGLSDAAAQSIAEAIGQLGSGNIDALGASDIQNLIVMAASRVGLNYGEMLNTGLDAKEANDLMLGVVEYLQEVAQTGTNVVKSQLANVFGVTVSDLVAVSNLGKDALNTVHKDMLSYKNMYGELEKQFDQLPSRLGISNILENLFSNLTYQTGMSIGSNPITYAIWKITDMIQGYTGGINLPFITAWGTGFDLNTTVENLMKLGVVGISTLGNIGKIASGLASIGNGSSLLKKLQVSQTGEFKTFGGSGLGADGQRESGTSSSETSYVGNSDSDTYYESTTNAANDEQQKKVDAKAEEFEDPTVLYFRDELKYADRLDKMESKLDTIIANQSAAGNASAAANNLLISLLQSGAVGGNTTLDITTPQPDVQISPEVNVDVSTTPAAPTVEVIAPNADTSNKITNSESVNNIATNMQAQASDVTIAALSAILVDIVAAQMRASEQSIISAYAPVAKSLTNIDTNTLGIISEVSALNGAVLSSIEALTDNIVTALETYAASTDSAYNNYSEKISQDLDTSYSNVAGDILNQIQLVKDTVDANINVTPDGINIEINIPTSDINVENEITTPIPEVVVNPEITNTVPNVTVEPNISVETPDVNVMEDVTVTSPNVDVTEDITVTPPEVGVTVNPQIDITNTVPNVTVDNQIENQIPDVNVNNQITNTVPDIIVNNTIINNIPDIIVEIPNTLVPTYPSIINNIQVIPNIINAAPIINVTPQITTPAPNIQFNPEIVNTVPNISVNPEIINNIPSVIVNPEIVSTIPEVIVSPQINVTAPNVDVVEDITVSPPDVQVDPQVEVINTVPNINVESNIVNDVSVPEVVVNPEISYTTPNIIVNNEVVNTVPDIRVDPTIIVPDNNPKTDSSQVATEFDRYMTEQGIVNNNSSNTNISNNADVSDYLIEIDFANGFKLLVENVSKIRSLLEETDSEQSIDDVEISGFTQYTFND